MNSPCDFTITRIKDPAPADFIRLEAKDGRKVLTQIDLSPSDFMSALTGQEIIAAITLGEGR